MHQLGYDLSSAEALLVCARCAALNAGEVCMSCVVPSSSCYRFQLDDVSACCVLNVGARCRKGM